MSDRDTDFGAFLAGFVLGGLAGAVTALLLAPQSGEETRLQIHDKSIELKDKAAVTAEEYKARADDYISSAQTVLEEQLERVQASKAETEQELAEEEASEDVLEDAPEELDEEADEEAA